MGAWILGRNMFEPVRGPWPDDTWNGWWATIRLITLVFMCSPTAHIDQHERRHNLPLRVGWHSRCIKQAVDATNGRDVGLGGGVATLRQYPRGGLVDKMHIAVSPVLVGSRERLYEDIDPGLGVSSR
jgi:dihydrofolate reductase